MLLNSCVLLIALLHLWFCILEMYFWKKPLGRKIFKLESDFAERSAPLAANQGLYNVFLSAGLVWSVLSGSAAESFELKIFFLSCVTLAGMFGGITVGYRIFLIQGLPAIVTLVFLFL